MRGANPGSVPLHVTPDPNFEHSIDNVSGLSAGGAKFRFFADSGLANADLYEVSALPGGAMTLKNLTLTSGVAAPFFPNLATLDVHASRTTGEARWIVDDRSSVGAGYDLWAVTDSGLSGKMATGLAVPPEFLAHEGELLALTRGSVSNQLLRLDDQGSPTELLSVPSAVQVSSLALSRNGSVAAVVLGTGGAESAIRLDTATGVWLPPGPAISEVHALSFSGNDRLLLSAKSGGSIGTFVMDVATGDLREIGPPAPVAFWIR